VSVNRIEAMMQNPPELEQLPASKVPFWIASMFSNTPEGQQKVLEIDSPQERLEYIISTLDEAFKHSSAALAIENVFASPSAEESATASESEAKKKPESAGDSDGETGKKGGPD
jgi:hypothetical protein